MTLSTEIKALKHYMEVKKPCSVIEEIINHRIAYLEARQETVLKIKGNCKPVIHEGIVYHSVGYAAQELRIAWSTLKDDINFGRFHYKVYPI